jgi:putative tryptophan/tyrosine transport system substrate-binding protein
VVEFHRGRPMRRRDFITLVGGAVSWPLTVQAQQPAIPVVGFLYGGGELKGQWSAFGGGLSESGFVERQNIEVVLRSADGRYERLPQLAAELIRQQVDAIVAGGAPAARAAKAQTGTIPIVFTAGADPVRLGLVESLNHPGGNLTGVNTSGAEVASKGLGVLRQLLPDAKVLAALVNSNNEVTALVKIDIEAAAGANGLQVVFLSAGDDRELDAAFAAVSQYQSSALLIANDVFFNSRADRLAALATRYKVPALYSRREFAVAGGLVAYGPTLEEAYHQVGRYIGLILRGEKPANLPVVLPTKFELVLNRKTAAALGLSVPPTLLAITDEVIEAADAFFSSRTDRVRQAGGEISNPYGLLVA